MLSSEGAEALREESDRLRERAESMMKDVFDLTGGTKYYGFQMEVGCIVLLPQISPLLSRCTSR